MDIRNLNLVGSLHQLVPDQPGGATDGRRKKFDASPQYWVWMRPDINLDEDTFKRQLERMHRAGIQHIAAQVYSSHKALWQSSHLPVASDWIERSLPIIRDADMDLHAWMWSMPCNNPSIHEEHPEWFAVNREGKSTITDPAYVGYYRFMCPSRSGVRKFVSTTVNELASIEGLAGVHLDYIRYPDVILPVGLWPKYDIVQDQEYAEYDYCYCDHCRETFSSETGIDPLEIEDPANHADWIDFRHRQVISAVNDHFVPAARRGDKHVTAAVFPNWENVRQKWSDWHLDAFLPMLYHNFYNMQLDWVGDQVKAALGRLATPAPIYAGLFVSAIPPSDVRAALESAYSGGASGVSLFDAYAMSEEHWNEFERAVKEVERK